MFGSRSNTLIAGLAALLFVSVAPHAARAVEVEAGTYKIDSVHSTIMWKVLHMGLTNTYGQFKDFDGTITVDADAAKSSVEMKIKVDSLDSKNDKRDEHLKGPDFFNTKQFPEATFKSTKISKAESDTYNVDGDLTLMGVTKPVSIKFKVIGSAKDPRSGKAKAGGEGQVTIKRSDFGMKPNPGLGDEVTLTIALEAGKQ